MAGGSKLGLGLELRGEGAIESFESCGDLSGLSDLPTCQRLLQHVRRHALNSEHLGSQNMSP
jgi:hypothetical protein